MRFLDPTDRDRAPDATLSLNLVAKKKAILQSELSKMEQRLRDRTAVLSQLRRHHEELLNVNGQLQQRNFLRKDKLDHLYQSVNQVSKASHSSAAGGPQRTDDAVWDSDAVNAKCETMKLLVESLHGRQELLEQGCMGMEDALTHKTDALRRAKLRFREASETLQLGAEEARSVEWAFEMEQAAVRDAESNLRLLGQQLELETLALEQSSSKCQDEATLHQELIRARENFCSMAAEAHEQLLADKNEATRCWKDSLSKLGRSGATCAKDEEVHQTQVALAAKLEQLTISVTTTKSTRRELVFRTKQEREMLSLTKSSIKAKEDQLEWLERQRAFLDSELQNLINSRAVKQAAYDESVLAFRRTLMSIDEEKSAAKSTIEQIESELADTSDALAALKSQIAKERKSLGQQVRKRNAKQKQLKTANTTLELIRADAKSAQLTLEAAQDAQNKHQTMLDKLVSENEEMKAKIAQLEDQNNAAEHALSTLSVEAEEESRLVESRMRTLKDTYLRDADFSDWRNVIPRIDRKMADAKVREQSKIQQQSANSAARLRSKYDIMFAALNEKFSKMLREKQTIFDTALKSAHSTRVNIPSPRRDSPPEESSTPTRGQISITTEAGTDRESGQHEQSESRAVDGPAFHTSCTGNHEKSNHTPEISQNPSYFERDDAHKSTSSGRGFTSESLTNSHRTQDLLARHHRGGNQDRVVGHFETDSPSDSTTSPSLATPPAPSPSPTRPFASPPPAGSYSKTRDSTRKKLQLRAKPRRKPHDRRQSTGGPRILGEIDRTPSANPSSRSKQTSVAVRQRDSELLSEPAEVQTPPVISSSQAALLQRQISAADKHQCPPNKEGRTKHSDDSQRGKDSTICGNTTTQSLHTPSSQTGDRVRASNNKENESPSLDALGSSLASQTQPKQPSKSGFSQAARSGRGKHATKKKIGTTIARKNAAKRLSQSGRKKTNASSAILSKTISGTGTPIGGIIDTRSISSTAVGPATKNGVRRPPSLASDWFATDSFSFD